MPVLQYECQVWGMHSPRVTAASCACLDLQRLYDNYLRTICGLLPSTPHKILLAELGLLPLQVFTVASDFAILEQLGCIACRLLLPQSLLGRS